MYDVESLLDSQTCTEKSSCEARCNYKTREEALKGAWLKRYEVCMSKDKDGNTCPCYKSLVKLAKWEDTYPEPKFISIEKMMDSCEKYKFREVVDFTPRKREPINLKDAKRRW